MRIFFDVHGTLLSTDDREIRPGAAGLIRELAGAGHEVTLWSTAGAGYARAFAERFGLLPFIFEFRSKRDFGLNPEVCVDDHPGYLVGTKGNVRVRPYHGGPNDGEMGRVKAVLASFSGGNSTVGGESPPGEEDEADEEENPNDQADRHSGQRPDDAPRRRP